VADFEATAAALRNHLIANFTALPLFWPNDDRKPAANGGRDGWVLSEIRLLDERPITIGPDGNRRHRDTGEFAIYVYVPVGSKAGTVEKHAAAIRAAFAHSARTDVIITRRTIGAGEHVNGASGRWWCVPVIVEWYSDRTE